MKWGSRVYNVRRKQLRDDIKISILDHKIREKEAELKAEGTVRPVDLNAGQPLDERSELRSKLSEQKIQTYITMCADLATHVWTQRLGQLDVTLPAARTELEKLLGEVRMSNTQHKDTIESSLCKLIQLQTDYEALNRS